MTNQQKLEVLAVYDEIQLYSIEAINELESIIDKYRTDHKAGFLKGDPDEVRRVNVGSYLNNVLKDMRVSIDKH